MCITDVRSRKSVHQETGETYIDDHCHRNSDNQHCRKSLDGTCTPDIHDQRCDQCCKLRVKDCREGNCLSLADSIWYGMTFVQFLSDSFKVNDIDVNCHTYAKHKCADSGQCEYCTDRRIQSENSPQICHKHDCCKHTWNTITDDQEQCNQSHTDHTCHGSLFQGI